MKKKRKISVNPVILIVGKVIVVGIVLRIVGLFRSLEYDEWWTLLNFSALPVKQILTDLALPNNHPLNTLCVSLFASFGIPELIRIPSLISGLLVIYLSFRIVRRTFGPTAGYLTAALVAFSAPLLVYSALARGYMMQVMFLLLTIEGLETLEAKRHLAEILIVTGGIGAMLSVPTGVLFLLPMALGFLILGGEKRKLPGAWIAAALLLIFVLCYYLSNFSALRAGQKWGEAVNSLPLYGKFLSARFLAFYPWLLLPWVLCGMIFDRKIRIVVLLSLTVLLLAPVTGAGPARVYMALAAICAAASATGAVALQKKMHHPAATVLCSVALLICATCYSKTRSQWQAPDHPVIWQKAIQQLPPTALPVVRATAAYPVCCTKYPSANAFFRERALRNDLTEIAMIGEKKGVFNGGGTNHGETTLDTGLAGKSTVIGETAVHCYQLIPATAVAAGKTYTVIVSGTAEELAAEYEALRQNGKILRLNEFLCTPVGDDRRILGVWLCLPEKDAELPLGKVWELR